MLQIKELKISDKFGIDFLNITFSIQETSEDITKYRFDLLRSYHYIEEYEIIASDIKDFNYADNTVNLYNIAIKYYYKVQITNIETNEVSLSDPVQFSVNEPDEYAIALVSQYNLYLETAINNESMLLLKKKHSGEICSCYDDVRGRNRVANCEICYNAKYVGGYYSPQELRVAYFNSPSRIEKFDVADVGEDETPIQLWTSGYPLIQVGDLFVDKNNARYIVMSWQPTYKNFYLLKQVVQIQRVPRSNVIYKIPIKLS
jgi:hypothetical protein